MVKLDMGEYGWPTVASKVKTTKVPLIGFEWEIPSQVYRVKSTRDQDTLTEKGYDFGKSFKGAYNYHFECGCLEMASPTAKTLNSIKSLAKDLIKKASKNDSVTFEDHSTNTGGIHVSVSKKGHAPNAKFFCFMQGCLNMERSKDFIWHFSGRGTMQNEGYAYQAQVRDHHSHKNKGLGYHGSMVKLQAERYEFRLWCNKPEYLVPSLEFTHSFFIFCLWYYNRYKGKRVPSLMDYKNWLFTKSREKSYKELKKFAPWDLLT